MFLFYILLRHFWHLDILISIPGHFYHAEVPFTDILATMLNSQFYMLDSFITNITIPKEQKLVK